RVVAVDRWIRDGNSFGGRKPKPSVASLPCRRLGNAVALNTNHAIVLAIGRARNGRSDSSVNVIQAFLVDAKNPSQTTHPKTAIIIFQNRKYLVAKESLFARIRRKPSVLQAIESSPTSTKPDIPVAVLVNCQNGIVRQPSVSGKAAEAPILAPAQPIRGSYPK